MPLAITDRTIRMSGAGLVGATASGFSSRLSAADARTLLGLSTSDSPTFAGLTLSGHLLFSPTNTKDVGDGVYDPRTVRAATSVLTPLVNNASAALTLGNSTYGVTVPGNATFSSTVTVSPTTGTAAAYASFINSGGSYFIGAEKSAGGELATGSLAYSAVFSAPASRALHLGSSGAVALTVASNGHVGIGTTNPQTGLDVREQIRSGNGTIQNVLSYDVGGYLGTISNHVLQFVTLATERMRLTTAGNLLIGTTTDDLTNKLQVAGAATFSGDISMQKTSAQGYIRSHGPAAVGRYTEIYHDDTRGYVTSNFGGLNLNPDGYVRVAEMAAVSSGGQIRIGYNYSTWTVFNGHVNYNAGVRIFAKTTTSQGLGVSGLPGQTSAIFSCDDSGGNQLFSVEPGGGARSWGAYNTKYTQTIHDGTNGIISTSAGNLNLVPTGGTVAVTGGITASGNVYCPNGSNYIKIDSANDRIEFFRSGITQSYIQAATAANAVEITTGLITGGNAKITGRLAATGALRSGAEFGVSDAAGVLDLWSPIGGDCYVAWTQSGAANRGVLGFSAGSGTLRYRSAATSMSTGTEVFTIGGTGNVTCAGITASGNLSFTGGLTTGFVTKSANYTLTASDHTVCVTANSIDITFETAVGCAGREHEVINSGSGVVTLKTTSAQTISGSASGALTLAQWKSIRVKSDGSNWLIMSQIT